jgi:hypothetical protein
MPTSMRGNAVLSLVVLLAGCSGGPAPLPTGRIKAYFPPGGVADAIVVDALDRLALRDAELVAPDGRTAAAQSIVAQPAPAAGAAVALPSGSYFNGSILAAASGNPASPGAVGGGAASEGRLLAVASQATIFLPDPAAYRRNWQKYRIRLRFGAPPDVERRDIAAPPPPPATPPP